MSRLRSSRLRPGNAPLWPAPDWWQGFGDPQLDQPDRPGAGEQSRHRPGRGAAAAGRCAGAPGRRGAAAHLELQSANATISVRPGQWRHRRTRPIACRRWVPATNWISGARIATPLQSAAGARAASAADRATVALTVTAARRQHLFPASVAARAHRSGRGQSEVHPRTLLNVVQRRVNAGYAAPAPT